MYAPEPPPQDEIFPLWQNTKIHSSRAFFCFIFSSFEFIFPSELEFLLYLLSFLRFILHFSQFSLFSHSPSPNFPPKMT
jgi:hypothetical protein